MRTKKREGVTHKGLQYLPPVIVASLKPKGRREDEEILWLNWMSNVEKLCHILTRIMLKFSMDLCIFL